MIFTNRFIINEVDPHHHKISRFQFAYENKMMGVGW